jgi:hypothetical protein
MSESFHDQALMSGDSVSPSNAAPEQLPAAAGVGWAQRSEPERSDGERSGASVPRAATKSPIPSWPVRRLFFAVFGRFSRPWRRHTPTTACDCPTPGADDGGRKN